MYRPLRLPLLVALALAAGSAQAQPTSPLYNAVRVAGASAADAAGLATAIRTAIDPEAVLTPDDGEPADRFGHSVSLSGNRALVGAYRNGGAAGNSGAAYVFVRSTDGTWAQEAKLTAADPSSGAQFGYAVSLSGDRALIGAVYSDGAAVRSGAAYVFVRSDGAWVQEAKLIATGGGELDRFGHAVSLSGDRALVGAKDQDGGGSQSGAAYVFVRSGTAWTQEARLTAADIAADDFFGTSVSLSDDRALIGSPNDDDAGLQSGSAYVFRRSGSAWVQEAKLTAADGAQGRTFGHSVSLWGERALVGALYGNGATSGTGAAYVFVRSGTAWAQEAKLFAQDGSTSDRFGRSVALSDEYALVGADFHQGPAGLQSGAAYAFVRSGGTWELAEKLDGVNANDNFGYSVSLLGSRALGGGLGGGSAYVFQIGAPPDRQLVVNDTRDIEDDDPADDVCDVDEGEGGNQCTLREALKEANARVGRDSVSFDIEGAGPHSITLAEPLPALTEPLVLDATTQPGYAGTPRVTLTGAIDDGLILGVGETTIRGLAIGGFARFGVTITGPGGNVLEANHIGVNAAGTAALPNLGGGVLIQDSPDNVVGGETAAQRNVISGNGSPEPAGEIFGVRIAGAAAANNRVQGNYIGTDVTGMLDLGNASAGVDITDAPDNLIGGSTEGARNVIAGNGGEVGGQLNGFGVGILGATATGNRIEGNYIGVAADGATALGNGTNGVSIVDAGENRVGGIAPSPGAPPGNVIAGHAGDDNDGVGIVIVGNEAPTPGQAPNNRVQGNLIGTNAAGTDSLSNGIAVLVNGNADGTLVGGAEAGARNVMAGSRLYGVYVTDKNRGAGPSGVRVQGNYIGTNAAGTDSLANRGGGIVVESLDSPVENVAIGGPEAGAGNVVAGNRGLQVLVGAGAGGDAVVSGVQIAGNTIGLFRNGQGAYPADDGPVTTGVALLRVDAAQIGLPGAGNTVSGNTIGVFLLESNESVVQGNRIGTNPGGTQRRPNGIGLSVQGSDNTIGGTTAGARNVISGNATAGINIEGRLTGLARTAAEAAAGRLASGAAARAEVREVRRGRSILGPPPADGLAPTPLGGGRADNNVVQGNFIGTTSGGNAPLGNGLGRDGDWQIPDVGAGIQIVDTAADNVIGGLADGTRNVISGNGIGIGIAGAGASAVTGTKVWNNHIGAGSDAETPVPNRWHGVLIFASSGNEVGPQAEGAGNVIAHNGGAGLAVGDGGFVAIRRTLFARNAGLAIDLGNDGVTPNDGGDGDSGPNGRQNFPELLYVTDGGGALSAVEGRLDAGGGGPFAVDLFASPSCDPLVGHGEGEAFLDALLLNGGGFEDLLSAVVPLGAYVTATATNASGHTSEFSACRRVVASEDLAEAEVVQGQTGEVLDAVGIGVEVTDNPADPAAGVRRRAGGGADIRRAAGTLYAARYAFAPDGSTFEGTATAPDGTAVEPNTVASARYWTLVQDGLAGVTYSACLDIAGIDAVVVPGQLVLVQRAGIGVPWSPFASTLEAGGTRLCAGGLAAWGDLGIGADSLVNPVPHEPGPEPAAPVEFALSATPNPARDAATLTLALPVEGPVTVEVFDALGRRVAVLHEGPLSAGAHPLRLDVGGLPSGLYVARATSGEAVATRSFTVVR